MQPPERRVNLPVPYIHQLWDTPESFDGEWACGAACAAMILAYYGLLAPKPMQLRLPEPHTSDYGWYVSQPFEHNGSRFDVSAPTESGEDAAGLYGAVMDRLEDSWAAYWHNGSKGICPLMTCFLPSVGNTVTLVETPKRDARYLERAPAEATMKATLDEGHPLIVSGFVVNTYHHLIVVRGYEEATGDDETRWLVNDPYGYRLSRSTRDGGNVLYSFDDIKPKYMMVFGGKHKPCAG